MKTETYTCDRCGHSQGRDRKFDGHRWMRTVSLTVEDGHNSGTVTTAYHGATLVKQSLWCDHCCEAVGVSPPPRSRRAEPALEPAPEPSLEDMVRALVRDEIQGVQS